VEPLAREPTAAPFGTARPATRCSPSGSCKVCLPVATIARGITNQDGSVGVAGGMLEAGGIVYGVGGDGWTAFVR